VLAGELTREQREGFWDGTGDDGVKLVKNAGVENTGRLQVVLIRRRAIDGVRADIKACP
jgi:hypothetical protein